MWEMNWLAVIGAALSGFLIGGLWYGPLFLKPWQRAAGVTGAQMQTRHPAKVFGGAFLLNVLAAFILGHVFATYGELSFWVTVLTAGGVALGFIVPAFGVNYLFAGKSVTLFLIDAGYWIVTYHVMGLVFALVG